MMLDQREHQEISRQDTDKIAHLCDRRFGIGADGLILLQNLPDYDFEMIYFNADGRESSMCGNGGRCIAAFAKHLGTVGDYCRFWAIDGEHEARITPFPVSTPPPAPPPKRRGDRDDVAERSTSPLLFGGGAGGGVDTGEGPGLWVELKMSDVQNIEQQGSAFILNTGSPHYVRFENNLENLDMVREGRAVRYSERFKAEGINVNLASEISSPYPPEGSGQALQGENLPPLTIRTYERGVEDETLACGTGVTAVAIAAFVRRGQTSGDAEVRVKARGGDLAVRFHANSDGSFSDIWLCGPAQRVFEGEIEDLF